MGEPWAPGRGKRNGSLPRTQRSRHRQERRQALPRLSPVKELSCKSLLDFLDEELPCWGHKARGRSFVWAGAPPLLLANSSPCSLALMELES